MERAKTEASIFENLAIAHAKSDNEEDIISKKLNRLITGFCSAN